MKIEIEAVLTAAEKNHGYIDSFEYDIKEQEDWVFRIGNNDSAQFFVVEDVIVGDFSKHANSRWKLILEEIIEDE